MSFFSEVPDIDPDVLARQDRSLGGTDLKKAER
jgi:hypothetical protein